MKDFKVISSLIFWLFVSVPVAFPQTAATTLTVAMSSISATEMDRVGQKNTSR